jgi:uncharacterized protein
MKEDPPIKMAEPVLAGMASVSARRGEIDALRGFALVGIVVVNAPYFAQPALAPAVAGGPADLFATWFTQALGTGKFFLLYSFLFGFGFVASLERAPIGPGSGVGRAWRRCLGLALLGFAHATLLFFGDILMLYAALGLVLLAVRHWSMTRLRRAIIASAGVTFVVQSLTLLPVELEGAVGVVPGEGYLGSFAEAVGQRWEELPIAQLVVLGFNGPAALTAMLLGVLAWRAGAFPLTPAGREWLRRWGRWALLAGGTVSGVAAVVLVDAAQKGQPIGLAAVLAAAAATLSAPVFALGMGGAVLRFALAHPAGRGTRWLEAIGAQSLSGYLLHSALLAAFFNGWGLGFYGRLGAAEVLLVALLTFVLIGFLLQLWRRWCRAGPAEWLLRAVVNGGRGRARSGPFV